MLGLFLIGEVYNSRTIKTGAGKFGILENKILFMIV